MTRSLWRTTIRSPWSMLRKSRLRTKAHYLERRIVFCADCEAQRALTFASGVLACSSCGSENWMYLTAKLGARFGSLDPKEATPALVERTTAQMRKEVFFSREAALV